MLRNETNQQDQAADQTQAQVKVLSAQLRIICLSSREMHQRQLECVENTVPERTCAKLTLVECQAVCSFILSTGAYLIQATTSPRRWSRGTKHKVAIFLQDYIPEDRHDKQNKVIHFITKKIIIYNMNSYII